MPDSSQHEQGNIDAPFPLNAQFRRGPELLIVKVVNDVLVHTLEIGCDEVRLESNDMELKIKYLFTGMCVEEEHLPAFYHDHLRKAVAELEGTDRGNPAPGEEWSFGALWNERSFRITLPELSETDIRITFSNTTSE